MILNKHIVKAVVYRIGTVVQIGVLLQRSCCNAVRYSSSMSVYSLIARRPPCYSSGEKPVSVPFCAGVDGPDSSAKGKCLEEVMSRMRRTSWNFASMFPHPAVIDVLL